MSRNIPAVRRWRVTHRTETLTLHLHVRTINKQFARWLTRDKAIAELGAAAFTHCRRTVSLAKDQFGREDCIVVNCSQACDCK